VASFTFGRCTPGKKRISITHWVGTRAGWVVVAKERLPPPEIERRASFPS